MQEVKDNEVKEVEYPKFKTKRYLHQSREELLNYL